MSGQRKTAVPRSLFDRFLTALEQGQEEKAIDALALTGAVCGIHVFHAVLVGAASVGMEEKMRRAGLDPGTHEWAVAPPPGSPYTIDELPIGPRTAVRWLAAVGNEQIETAWALFQVMNRDEHPLADVDLFLRTIVRSLCEAWSTDGPWPPEPH